MKGLVLISFILIGVLDLRGYGQTASPSPADRLIGRWRGSWTGRGPAIVEIHADGTAKDDRGHSGVWKLVSAESDEAKYEITWSDWENKYEVFLAPDGKKLHGKSEVVKAKIWAEKIEDSGDGSK